MKARAPGKVVISGAYSVLWGAPCIVTAVDRFVEADSGREASFVSEEMRQAMNAPYPHFDATALRNGDQKLGLGSSAAILLAALGCTQASDPSAPEARVQLFERGVFAHRRAQGGGSGVDVAASCFGGTLSVVLPEPLAPTPTQHALGCLPSATQVTLPDVQIQVWASPSAAVTSQFIRKVSAWALSAPNAFAPLLGELTSAANAALAAVRTGDARGFIAALDRQSQGLDALGGHVGLPICVPEVQRLATLARSEGATVLPAGAGGGDVSLYVGMTSPSAGLNDARALEGLVHLPLELGAQGVHWV